MFFLTLCSILCASNEKYKCDLGLNNDIVKLKCIYYSYTHKVILRLGFSLTERHQLQNLRQPQDPIPIPISGRKGVLRGTEPGQTTIIGINVQELVKYRDKSYWTNEVK